MVFYKSEFIIKVKVKQDHKNCLYGSYFYIYYNRSSNMCTRIYAVTYFSNFSRILRGYFLQFFKQTLSLILHRIQSLFQELVIFRPFFHIFMPINIQFGLRRDTSGTASFLADRSDNLPVLEQIVIIEHHLYFIHFGLVS